MRSRFKLGKCSPCKENYSFLTELRKLKKIWDRVSNSNNVSFARKNRIFVFFEIPGLWLIKILKGNVPGRIAATAEVPFQNFSTGLAPKAWANKGVPKSTLWCRCMHRSARRWGKFLINLLCQPQHVYIRDLRGGFLEDHGKQNSYLEPFTWRSCGWNSYLELENAWSGVFQLQVRIFEYAFTRHEVCTCSRERLLDVLFASTWVLARLGLGSTWTGLSEFEPALRNLVIARRPQEQVPAQGSCSKTDVRRLEKIWDSFEKIWDRVSNSENALRASKNMSILNQF